MEISSTTLSLVLAVTLVPTVYILMRKIKSLQYVSTTDKDFKQLRKEYARWEIISSFLMILFIALIGFLIWLSLLFLSEVRLSFADSTKYIISPIPATWGLPALFLAILIATLPIHYLYLYLLGKERYVEYIEYINQKFGMDSWKLLTYMAYVIILICLVFIFLSLDTYVRVTENKFFMNRFFSLGEREYSFDEIIRIKLVKSSKAPNGRVVRESYYVFKFIDGEVYNFHKSLHDLKINQQHEIAKYIIQVSGKELEIADPYPR